MQPLRVLAIDDDDFVRDLISEILLPPRFELRVAPSAADGLELLAQRRPDLVLLDVDLGGDENGFDVCRRIVAGEAPPPVVFLTSHEEPSFVDTGLQAGAAAYLCKPFSPLELLDRIAAVTRSGGR